MERQALLKHYRDTRHLSLELCRPLQAEDYRIQSMPDVSPPWWNLGHTSWFFSRNVLHPAGRTNGMDERLDYVLNSYYESLGPRLPRAERGLVTRPTTDEIYAFRTSVDERMEGFFASAANGAWEELRQALEAGVHHEQQHQELLVTEVKHILWSNAPELRDSYPVAEDGASADPVPLQAVPFEGGVTEIGNLEGGWCFDNELAVHKVYLQPFALANRLVTNGEYQEFIAEGGYSRPLLWLSNGWARVKEEGWKAPLYWESAAAKAPPTLWTLGGMREIDPQEPVAHLSFYEADAFARWKGETNSEWKHARLPTEQEWEHAARTAGFDPAAGNFLDDRHLQPRRAGTGAGSLLQTAGDLWEWTVSHYEPYPGYRPFGGNLTEYNGKFMDNQRVLRGGSCATPRNHIRASYRNFWPGDTRFQMSGLRLAVDL